MAITFDWNINDIRVRYSSASLSNIVTTIGWIYRGVAEGTSSLGESGSFNRADSGTVVLDIDDNASVASEDFVAYESLTRDLVLGWVTASLGDTFVTNLQARVSGSINEQAESNKTPNNNVVKTFKNFFILISSIE